MDIHTLVTDFGYHFSKEIPVFFFVVSDIQLVKQALDGMYVEFNVLGDRQALTYVLDIPDRQIPPLAIPLKQQDLPRIQKGAKFMNICPTIITSPTEDVIAFTEFVEDITHDWTGKYAEAVEAFTANKIEDSKTLLHELIHQDDQIAAAHHKLGRCYRAKNELNAAIACYQQAIQLCTHTGNDRLLPRAAGMLSDMGVAYKVSGDRSKAAHCLLYSLSIRPNHPAALATFATLFGEADEVFLHCMARMIKIGGWDGLVEQVLTAYAGGLGKDKHKLFAIAQSLSTSINLTVWPLKLDGELTSQRFFEELQQK